MTDANSISGTLTRTRKQSDAPYPHYFNAFQNYCSGPKSKTVSTSPSATKDHLPIPEIFKKRADEILNVIHRLLIEKIAQIPQTTSVLPREFFEQDREFDIQKYLIDRTMFKTMNDAGVINWVSSLKKLYPIRTSGNGNCLLHAVLISMVGVHDFDLYLRDRLRHFMSHNTELLKENWKTERVKTDKIYGIQSEESKFDSEWEELCDLVRYENSEDGQTASNLQFLEAVHIFSLSNMLARPIIILSEEVVRNKHGEAISYNDLFGIYLPLLAKRETCTQIPIVLVYDQSHFCPLQTSDLDTGTTSDNYLPLYQSVEHTRKQTLLPIRFLGSDATVEATNALLKKYLRIKTLSFYPETTAASVPIVCAELGTKHLPENHNFFLLYYNYLMNFFETQKRKVQDDEEEKRLREQEYRVQNPPAYEPSQQPTLKNDISSSPPPYSSLSLRSNDNKKPLISERRPSYGEAVTNGVSSESSSNHNNNRPPNQYSEPQITYSNSYNTNNMTKQYQPASSNWEPVDDVPISNGKATIYIGTSTRASDSKLKQEQRVPVHFDSPGNLIDFDQRTDRIRLCIVCNRNFHDVALTSLCPDCTNSRRKPPPVTRTVIIKSSPAKLISPSTNLVDFEQRTDQIRPCIVCSTLIDDISRTGLCSKCDYNKNPSAQRHVTIRRAPVSNNYSTSDFLAPHTSSPKIRGPLKIICHYCKRLNMINHVQPNQEYTCSICYRHLRIPNY